MNDPVVIRVPRKPKQSFGPYAEIMETFRDAYGVSYAPVHACDMEARIRHLIKTRRGFDTVSSLALDIVGYLIRTGDLPLPVHVHYSNADNEVRIIQYDTKGDFVEPWPEEPGESVHGSDFYYRMAGGSGQEIHSWKTFMNNCPQGPVFG